MTRWTATIYYRTENGVIDVVHHILELDEIADLVEHGPDWNTIVNIDIRMSFPYRGVEYTIEKSEME